MKFISKITKHGRDILIDVFVFGLAGLIVLFAILLIWISTLDIPDLSAFEHRKIIQSTKIYDRTGKVILYDMNQDVKRTIIPISEMSRYIKNATIAIEDDQFYNHIGVDFKAIARAFVSNLKQGNLLKGQGGSTITQQVIKNSLLDREKKLSRKIKEAILAIKLERVLSKDEILETYLNESPYGGTVYGVEEASLAFFGKNAKDLTLAEAAYLAAIPQAPTYYSPYGTHKDKLDERKNLVLERMRLNGFITISEYENALEEKVEFKPKSISNIKAPHFVMYVIDKLTEMYDEKTLLENGFKIITTLDWNLQQQAEEILSKKVEENSKRFNATNAGLVAVDPKNGDLLVMVGSRDYFDEKANGNFNVTLAKRQPGSAIKPFIYANAFRKGYLPSTVLFDVKTQFSTACEPYDFSSTPPCYSPNNYNGKFRGPVSMRNALAGSLNIPAIKTLYLVGIKDTIKLVSDMGITTLTDPDRYGLTLVLGGGEVRLLDMAYAYGVFANGGKKAKPRSILRIEKNNGEIFKEIEVSNKQILDKNVAYMISDVLSDNKARTPLWGPNSLVYFKNRDVAAKSGSTNDLRDAWIMGYTPNLVVGAWFGNNNNEKMGGGLSGLITTPMWREFMDIAIETRPEESFPEPTINTEGVKPILRGSYLDTQSLVKRLQNGNINISGFYSNVHSILHYVDKNNPLGNYPVNPAKDSQYTYWEYGVKKWYRDTYGSWIFNTIKSKDDNKTPEQDESNKKDKKTEENN